MWLKKKLPSFKFKASLQDLESSLQTNFNLFNKCFFFIIITIGLYPVVLFKRQIEKETSLVLGLSGYKQLNA